LPAQKFKLDKLFAFCYLWACRHICRHQLEVETMSIQLIASEAFGQEIAERCGFRFGAKGTHTSRTIMFEDLQSTLEACSESAARAELAAAIIENNCLGKQTLATRRLSCQRLSELYSLDPEVPVFAALFRLWRFEAAARPQLALLCAIARDPLLAATARAIIALPPGEEFRRDDMRRAVREAVGDRLNDSILDKVVRNAASSWTQAGHLVGRTLKRRHAIEPSKTSIAYAVYLAHVSGFRGMGLFNNGWTAVLDCSPTRAKALALDAKRAHLLDLRMSGDVVEVGFSQLDPTYGGE